MSSSSMRFCPTSVTAPAVGAVLLALAAPARGQQGAEVPPPPVEEQPSAAEDAAAPVQESPAPAQESPAPAAKRDCVPPCRDAFTCLAGVCVSKCNPPCASEERCTPQAQCVREEQWTQQPAPAPPMLDLEMPGSGLERTIVKDPEYERYRRKKAGGIVLIVLAEGLASAATAFSVVAVLEPDLPVPVLVYGGFNVAATALLIPGVVNLSKGIRGQSLVIGHYEAHGGDAGPAPPVADPPGRPGLRTGGWIFLGAGIACAAGGVVTGVMAEQSRQDEMGNVCNSETGCTVASDPERGDQLLLTANILFAASNLLGAIGGAMLIVGIMKEGGDADASLRPMVGPRHAGLALTASF
jgi:hypothetical protein